MTSREVLDRTGPDAVDLEAVGSMGFPSSWYASGEERPFALDIDEELQQVHAIIKPHRHSAETRWHSDVLYHPCCGEVIAYEKQVQ